MFRPGQFYEILNYIAILYQPCWPRRFRIYKNFDVSFFFYWNSIL